MKMNDVTRKEFERLTTEEPERIRSAFRAHPKGTNKREEAISALVNEVFDHRDRQELVDEDQLFAALEEWASN
jgi:hypothetical protein